MTRRWSDRMVSGRKLWASIGTGTALIGLAAGAALSVPASVATAVTSTSASTVPTQSAMLTSSDATSDDGFGRTLAVSGSTMVVGAGFKSIGGNEDVGEAYVFSDTSGSWIQTAKLTAADGALGDEFGEAVAIDGHTIVIGAPQHTVGTNADQGAVYVFSDTSGSWTKTAELSASDGQANDGFGAVLAVSGSTIGVAEPDHRAGALTGQGAALVFSDTAGTWSQTAELTTSDPTFSLNVGDAFGSIAISGSNIVVGASAHAHGSASTGAVYEFTDTDGTWAQTAELTVANGDQFGWLVAISGTTIVVSSIEQTVGGNIVEGALFVFSHASGSWVQTDELVAPDGTEGYEFGDSLGFSGNTIVSGPNHHVSPGDLTGGLYVFTGSPGSFTETAKLDATPASSGAFLGHSVAVSGNTIFGGAEQTVGTTDDEGVVYVFDSGPTISGKITGHACSGEDSCTSTDQAGLTVLVTGTAAADSSPVSVTATTAADGTWSAPVPAGTYTVGPTIDGTTIYDGPSFAPHKTSVTVGTASVQNVNFASCVIQPASEDAAGTRARAVAAEASGAAGCISTYTVNIKASIHQPVLVDPSEDAHYNSTDDPDKADYRDTSSWIPDLLRQGEFSRHLAAAPEFPECFSDKRVEDLTADRAKVRWSSYIKTGTVLGGGKVTLTYNQSDKHVGFGSDPTVSKGVLTRVFKWRLFHDGKVTTGQCSDKAQVPVLMSPVLDGMEGAEGTVPENGFTILTSWQFPFDPPGVKIDPEGSVLQTVLNPINEFNEVIESNKVVSTLKELGIMVASHLTLGKVVHTIRALPAAVRIASAGKVSAKVIKALVAVGEYAEDVHHAQSAQEVMGFIGSFLGFGEKSGAYPVMDAVVRGKFTTVTVNRGEYEKVPVQTTLALSVASTKFPKISVTVSRQADPNPQFTVFTGQLPWKGGFLTNEASTNPTFANNPTGVITKTAHVDYASGEESVERLKADTSQTPAVAESLEKHDTLLSELFPEEQKLAAAPVCTVKTDTPTATSAATMCWQFGDGRA
jgi:hypothetical protein